MGSTKIINDWVSYQTHEKIQDMISENSICPETVSVLISALYFKGEWLEKFDPNLTMKQRFHVSPEETIEVPTMLAEMDIAPVHNDELKSTVIALPYRGNRMIMYILLPMDTFGLSELETKISSDSFDPSILDKITGIKKATKLYLPKFKIESTHDMKEGLRQQGIIDLFSRKCDLSGVGGTPGEIYASEVFQKAVIHVNEEGSEMTGATSMTLVPCSLVDVESLAVDHPFLFIIKDRETGLILFLGRVVRP
ncbi:alaserpin isoform X2 [Lepeophtheirus salmonis]|nr:alaserpin-like isoform X2 [Lepeophtheirus salmonis]